MTSASTSSVGAGSGGVVWDLAEIARDVFRARELIYQLTVRDLRVRYKQALMGLAWAVLTPMLVVAASFVVRIALVNVAGDKLDMGSAAGIVVKGLAWSFFSGAVGFGTNALTQNAGLIGKVYFPREALPLSVMLASSFDTSIAVVSLTLMLPFLGWVPSWSLLWTPMLALVLFAFTLAVVLLSSCANLFFRDVKYIVQLSITFGIFFTPVFYEPVALGARSVTWQMANPLSPLLEGLRLAVAENHDLLSPIVGAGGVVLWTPLYLAYSAAVAFLGLAVSALVFHRAQYRFAEYL